MGPDSQAESALLQTAFGAAFCTRNCCKFPTHQQHIRQEGAPGLQLSGVRTDPDSVRYSGGAFRPR